MDLILFDVDGTLIHSMRDDGECLVAALREEFGFSDIDDDWSTYQFITDAGIMREAYRERRGHEPSTEDVAAFRDRFVALLDAQCSRRPLRAVAGAGELLAALTAQEDIAVAFATGCFLQTADLKMRSAGLSFAAAPVASCNDAISREDIMRIAVDKAASLHAVEKFDNAVYVGDGIWDVWACRRLGFPFIGVTADVAAERLQAEGVECLLPDLSDQALFHAYRRRARAAPA